MEWAFYIGIGAMLIYVIRNVVQEWDRDDESDYPDFGEK
jgi:hypothetical protein